MSQLNPTTYALLGLLAIRSWTAYELTRQMRRALRYAWPRSEANLYSEIKRLVPLGLAVAVAEEHGGRSRTRYQITEEGRAALDAWLATSPQNGPQVQFETLLRLFVADQGTLEELRRTIAHTRHWIITAMAEDALPIVEEYASEPPYPGRAHLNVLFIHFMAGFVDLVMRWCDDAEAEMDTWSGTATGVGLTPGTRRMLDDALAFYREAVARHRLLSEDAD